MTTPNRDIDFRSLEILRLDTLATNSEQYALVLLSPAQVDAVLSLQDIIFADLTAEQQSFVVRKDRAFFEAHFAKGNVALGVVHNGRLVAQSLVTMPTPEHPYTGMTDMELPAPLAQLAVLHSTVVHPDYRGNDLQNIMIKERVAFAHRCGRTHVLSEVAADNSRSWHNLLQEGLQIHSIGVDASDGTMLYNMHGETPRMKKGELSAHFNGRSRKLCPQKDLDRQRELIDKGYKGIAYDRQSATLTFAKPKP